MLKGGYVEKAQLFKRLHVMTMDELHRFIKPQEEVSVSLRKLDLAARTRHIIRAIQLEDMWQSSNDQSKTFDIYLSMKLSPETLCSCLDFDEDMNSLEWRLVLPKWSDIEDDLKPECFGDYLALTKKMEIMDIDEYDIDLTCSYLDKAYDFANHKNQQSKGDL
jgi:hypothetical protein